MCRDFRVFCNSLDCNNLGEIGLGEFLMRSAHRRAPVAGCSSDGFTQRRKEAKRCRVSKVVFAPFAPLRETFQQVQEAIVNRSGHGAS